MAKNESFNLSDFYYFAEIGIEAGNRGSDIAGNLYPAQIEAVIQNGNGSISNFLAKLGAFPQDYMTKQAQAQAALLVERASSDDMKQNLEQRVASAAARVVADSTAKAAAEKATILPGVQDEGTPTLPNSNHNFSS